MEQNYWFGGLGTLSAIEYFEKVSRDLLQGEAVVARIADDLFRGQMIAKIREDLQGGNPLLLEELTRNASVHALGFSKLPLWIEKGGRRILRLHCWDAEAPNLRQVSDIHDHRFSFHSYLVRGELINKVWIPGSEVPTHRYWYVPENNFYTLYYKGSDSLSLRDEKSLVAGDIYSLHEDDLHTSEPQTDFAVTLFLEEYSDPPKLGANVYSNGYETKDHVFQHGKQHIKAEEFLRTLQRIEAQCL